MGTVPAPTNSPKNLLTYIDQPLAMAKSLELLNVDERIDQVVKRNNGLAAELVKGGHALMDRTKVTYNL